MGEMQLQLTAEEREYLVEYLGKALKNVQVEEHRTRTLTFREQVTHEKELLTGILSKLAEASARQASPVRVEH